MSKFASQIPMIMKRLEKTLTPAERLTFIEVAIARSVSLDLQLPTSPVSYVPSHFSSTHNQAVSQRLSEINEVYIINTERVFNLVRGFYQLRYDLVFTPRNFSRILSVAALGATDLLPPVVVDTMAKFDNKEVEEAFNELIYLSKIVSPAGAGETPILA